MAPRRKSSGWEQFYQIADVAGTPDTTYIAAAGVQGLGWWGTDGAGTGALDLYVVGGAGLNLDAVKLEFIFTIFFATDADGKTADFELYCSMGETGPREFVAKLALIAGKAEVVVATDTTLWVDSITATTNGRGVTADQVGINNHNADNVASVIVPVLGKRFWEGLFTGAGSTGTIVTAYYRWYTE